MKLAAFLFGAACLGAPLVVRAQDPNLPPGPGAQQDAEAAREKLLKAADQIDLIETNAEAAKADADGMKADIAKLQADNADLKQQIADLRAALDAADARQARDRETLLADVANLIAVSKHSGTKSAAKSKAALADSDPAPSSTPGATTASAPPADTSNGTAPADTNTAPAPPPRPKGYYHIVEGGETLTMITSAYREKGVKVTVSEIRKANGLTEDSMLKVGQKLFIPQNGTNL